MKKEEKKFRQLSDEELEKVTGGGDPSPVPYKDHINNCTTDYKDYCGHIGGVWKFEDCTCNGIR